MKKIIVSLLIILAVLFVLTQKNIEPTKMQNPYQDIITSIDDFVNEKYNHEQVRYNLVYLNDDDTPELVVDIPGYYEGIITMIDDYIYTVGDGDLLKSMLIVDNEVRDISFVTLLGYGTSGRTEYKYYPKTGIVFCEIASPEETYIEYYKLNGNNLDRIYKTDIEESLSQNVSAKVL